jgi:hypothetical protein
VALRMLDGFDHYATADIAKKWPGASGPNIAIEPNLGRRSTHCLRASNTITPSYVAVTLGPQPIWIVGFSLLLPSIATNVFFLSLWDGAGGFQCELRLNLPGTLSFLRTPTVLGTTTQVLTLAVWHYLELRVVISTTVGAVEIRVDGVPWLTLAGVNTQSTAQASAAQIRLGNVAGSNFFSHQYYDDLYICDGTGGAPHHTFLGDCQVHTLYPNADGTAQQWVPSTPGTHYTCVDDAVPNTTDYVSSPLAGQRDTYGMQNLAVGGGRVYGVQLDLAVLKSDTDARLIRPVMLSGAAAALGAVTALGTTQTITRHIQTTNPATAAAWTVPSLNAAQCGAESA